jgi:TonB family protein
MFSLLVLVAIGCSTRADDSGPDHDAILLDHPAIELPRTELGTQILPPSEGADCRVAALVGADGSVRRADADRSPSCTPTFARAAQATVLGWRFTPATRDGVAVATHRQLVVRFDRSLLRAD